MYELLKRQLAENGADVEGALRRFIGNEALYVKFFLKLKDDPSYGDLNRNLEQGNYEEAFKAAHTLKGVSANLGLTPLYQNASAMTELLRRKNVSGIDPEQVALQKKALEESYQIFVRLIEENT